MEAPGITVAELEVALEGMYSAPKDPDAPVVHPEAGPPEAGTGRLEVAGAPGITVGEMSSIFGDLYVPPSLEGAA